MEAHKKDQDWKTLAKPSNCVSLAGKWPINSTEERKNNVKKFYDIVEFLRQDVESNPTVTLKELQLRLASEMNSRVSVNTLVGS